MIDTIIKLSRAALIGMRKLWIVTVLKVYVAYGMPQVKLKREFETNWAHNRLQAPGMSYNKHKHHQTTMYHTFCIVIQQRISIYYVQFIDLKHMALSENLKQTKRKTNISLSCKNREKIT